MSLKKIRAAIDLLEEKKRLFPDQAGHFDDVLSVLQEKDAATALTEKAKKDAATALTEEAEKLGMYTDTFFPLVRRGPLVKDLSEEEVQAKMAELRASTADNSGLPCMRRREGCDQPRMGSSVLCEAHTEEVLRGERRAPPIRQNIDYTTVACKPFFVELLEDPKKR